MVMGTQSICMRAVPQVINAEPLCSNSRRRTDGMEKSFRATGMTMMEANSMTTCKKNSNWIVELLERQKHLCLIEHYYQQTDARHHPKIEHEVTLY